MIRIQRNKFFLLRLPALLLFFCCISTLPDPPTLNLDALSSPVLLLPETVRIVISKSQYTLVLFRGERQIKTYRVAFGRGYSDGDKRMLGDKRTPEGEFYICTMNRSKRFYKFMGLSYPGMKHAGYALRAGLITQTEYLKIKQAIDAHQQPPWDTRLGGAVGIHGRVLKDLAVDHSSVGINWTDGCIALENADVDEIFDVVALGTPVAIVP